MAQERAKAATSTQQIVARTGRARTAALVACVLISGGAVMVYEFLAVRFLARFFGSSLDVWAAVIAVLLVALSLGYALGGLLADRFGATRPIAVVLMLAGVTGGFMEAIAVRVGERLLETDAAVMWHPYIAAALASFVPIAALGAVLPQAIGLRAARTGRLGAAAGWMAALSTVGSILGVMLTVHVLLPRIGVRETLYGTSGVLLVTGLALFVCDLRRASAGALIVLLAPLSAGAQVIFEDYSAYHHILVEDVANKRILRFDDAEQSTMLLADVYAGGFEYTEFFHVPVLLDPTITSVLFVGLGGGTGPKVFLRDYPHMRVEVVEIDPMVVEVARDFFSLPSDPRLQVVTRDGRVHLQRGRRTYGAIIMDAYASGRYGAYLPPHLVTREFFDLAWQRLENGGSLVYNVVGAFPGDSQDLVQGIYATLGMTFQAVYAFGARTSVNTVFVAQKIDPRGLRQDGTRDGRGWPQDPWLRHPLSAGELAGLARTLMDGGLVKSPQFDRRVTQFSGIQGVAAAGPVYTDNYAPVDIATGRRRGLRR